MSISWTCRYHGNVVYIQYLVKSCQFVVQILSENEILTSIKAILCYKFEKKPGNNPNLDLVNVNAYTKFGQLLSIFSKDIEWKQNSDINQGP